MFLRRNHSWEEWQGLFHDMISYGASGTDEQWDHINKYFLQTLTVTNVNKAREDELMGVLQVDEDTAIRIVRRQPLRSISELEARARGQRRGRRRSRCQFPAGVLSPAPEGRRGGRDRLSCRALHPPNVTSSTATRRQNDAGPRSGCAARPSNVLNRPQHRPAKSFQEITMLHRMQNTRLCAACGSAS